MWNALRVQQIRFASKRNSYQPHRIHLQIEPIETSQQSDARTKYAAHNNSSRERTTKDVLWRQLQGVNKMGCCQKLLPGLWWRNRWHTAFATVVLSSILTDVGDLFRARKNLQGRKKNAFKFFAACASQARFLQVFSRLCVKKPLSKSLPLSARQKTPSTGSTYTGGKKNSHGVGKVTYVP